MATAGQIRELLRSGHSYETAARELGVPAGFVFMVATGVPADASGAPCADLPDWSTQQLVNPPRYDPTRKERVLDWVRRRAGAALSGGDR